MNTRNQVIRGAITGLLALGSLATAGQVLAQAGNNEKCAGIAKAGKNDCGTSKSSCAGSISVDRDAEAWVFVPKGTCEKIAGGALTNKAFNAPGGLAALSKK